MREMPFILATSCLRKAYDYLNNLIETRSKHLSGHKTQGPEGTMYHIPLSGLGLTVKTLEHHIHSS